MLRRLFPRRNSEGDVSVHHSIGPVKLEKENPSADWEILDEKNPEQPFLYNSAIDTLGVRRDSDWMNRSKGFVPASLEGFYHNPEAHREVGRFLSQRLHLKNSSKVLEFGCGENYHVAEGIAQNSGAQVILLDDVVGNSSASEQISHVPHYSHDKLGEFGLLGGDISLALEQGSVLKRAQHGFDCVVTNGALVAGGYNFTAAEAAEVRFHEQSNDHLSAQSEAHLYFLDEYYAQLFHAVKQLLKPGGTFVFSSSRFANHGAGYSSLQLPDEKTSFLRFIDLLRQEGATRITLVGVSPEGMQENFAFNWDAERQSDLESVILRELFVGALGPSPYSMSIKDADGNEIQLSTTETLEMIQDPERRKELLSSPGVNELFQVELEKKRSAAQQSLDTLCGPVEKLKPNIYVPEAILDQAKRRNKDFPRIARIDSVYASF